MAWKAGRPHEAWEIIDRAGLAEHWPRFQREALRWARDTYRRRMAVYRR